MTGSMNTVLSNDRQTIFRKYMDKGMDIAENMPTQQMLSKECRKETEKLPSRNCVLIFLL